MTTNPRFFVQAFTFFISALSAFAVDDYKLGPDSQFNPDVPHGEVTKCAWTNSHVFPGTKRDYWVYVPKQYDPAKPAAVMVFQDGGGYVSTNADYRATIAFDNLIARKELPVIIGIFINPGVIPNPDVKGEPQKNRSFEYDSLGDAYARFCWKKFCRKWERNIT